MIMLIWCNANANTNGVTWPESICCTSFQLSWPKESNGAIDNTVGITTGGNGVTDQKVMLHLILIGIELKNAMDTINDTIGFMWLWCQHQWHHMAKTVLLVSFSSSWPIKLNCAIEDTAGIMWDWHQQQWHYMTKKLYYTMFQSSWLSGQSSSIDNGIGITWCWCQCQQCQITEKVILHLIVISWTNKAAVLLMMLSVSSCFTFFQSPWPNKQNGTINNAISVMCCLHWC